MPQDPTPKERARALRTHQPPPEQALWKHLRAHRLLGVKFARQVPVGPYILDFAARSRKLAIELDGDTHGAQMAYDAARTAYLEARGYRVIRFTNAEILGNAAGVLEAIAAALASPPLPDGEREQGGPARSAPAPLQGREWKGRPPQAPRPEHDA